MALQAKRDHSGSQQKLDALFTNVTSIVRGKDSTVELAIVSLLAGGHLLLEDIPGMGKTLLALALARSIDAPFRRIQFTNDTIPADILGMVMYSRKTERFRFVKGPIFAGVVLADEINRTSPKTQSALLEAMTERRVTVENRTFTLPDPFIVVATQNPVEHHGTFPLPESQLDRFLLCTQLGYPDAQAEKDILQRNLSTLSANDLPPVLSGSDVAAMRSEVLQIHVEDSVTDYLIRLANATRQDKRISLAVSPRGSLALKHAAQALAFFKGRDFVRPDDLKQLAKPVWVHRLIPADNGHGPGGSRTSAEAILSELLDTVPVPV